MNPKFETVREALDLIREIQALDDKNLRDRLYQLVMSELDPQPVVIPPPPAGYIKTEVIENGRSITSFGPEPSPTPHIEGRELIGSQRAITREPFQITDPPPRKASRRSTSTRRGTQGDTILKALNHFPEGIFASELAEVIDDPDLKSRVSHILWDLAKDGQCVKSRGKMAGKDAGGRNSQMYKYYPISSLEEGRNK